MHSTVDDAFWDLLQALCTYCDELESELEQEKPSTGQPQYGEQQTENGSTDDDGKNATENVEEEKDDGSDDNDDVEQASSPTSPPPPPPELDEMQKDSPSVRKWLRQRTEHFPELETVDQIMALVGMEEVKDQILRMRTSIRTALSHGADLSKDHFNTVLVGNAGTGKSTFARLYARFLMKMKVVPGDELLERTPIECIYISRIAGTTTKISELADEGGGVFFVDDAHTLFKERPNMVHLLGEMDRYRGQVVFLFASHTKEAEKFLGSSPSVPTRVPIRINFRDYSEEELRSIMCRLIRARSPQKEFTVEDGFDGVNIRILTRRLSRGRGSGTSEDTFHNARVVEAALSKVFERQACRLEKERSEGKEPNDFFLNGDDLIGPPPEESLKTSAAWKELQGLVGMDNVKEAIFSFFHRIRLNYELELEEKPPLPTSLNQVFLGPPGTGKTTVSKLYARILRDMGLVSRGEVMVRNPSDFIGRYIGQTEENTKKILQAAMGNILVIDEAHMMFGGKRDGGLPTTDKFRTALRP